MKQTNNHQIPYFKGNKPKVLALTIAMICSPHAIASQNNNAQETVINAVKQSTAKIAKTAEKYPKPRLDRLLPDTKAEQTDITTKIVGGSETNPGQYPFMVSLADDIGHFCGASIISPTYVMSAAHCSGGSFHAVIGAHDQYNLSGTQTINVKRQINHPNYGSDGWDISVYELEEPIDPALYSPVKLGNTSHETVGTMATAIGWGVLSQGGYLSRYLQHVDVPIMSHQQCQAGYDLAGQYVNESVEICAGYPQGGQDSCQGDSGGPLVVQENGEYVQVGVVSWGVGCAQPDYAGVYARVSALSSWVSDNVPDLYDGGGTGGGGSCYSNNITLNLQMDNYGYETSWEIRDGNNNVVYSGSGYASGQYVSETLNLADGNYTFTIDDTYGDGMTEGNGGYELIDSATGTVIKSGSNFGYSESTSLCTDGGGTGGGGGPINPDGPCYESQVKLILQNDNSSNETSWEIINSSGNIVYSGGNYASNELFKEFYSLSNGNYRFTAYDSGGDGLTSGTGKFTLRDTHKQLILKGIDFGSQTSRDFCIAN